MEYAPNPKHKEPWQRGRRGSLCPAEITREIAVELLTASVEEGQGRYATFQGRAYKAFEDADGARWHGFPVAWVEVPEVIWRAWLSQDKIQRSDLRRYWTQA